MIELHAHSPALDLLPFESTGINVSEVWPLELTSLAPLGGQKSALTKALRNMGLDLPPAGRSVEAGERAVIWTGRDQYMVVGAQISVLPAACTDQSDAWCVLDMTGPEQFAVLARLCPLDLEHSDPGSVSRTLVGHLNAILWRREDCVRVMVFRAFAKTLIRELREVAHMVDARNNLQNSNGSL